MTLSHIFDAAGLQLAGSGLPLAQPHVQAVPGPLLGPAPASLQPVPLHNSLAPNPASLHAQSLPAPPTMPPVASLPQAVPLHMQAAAALLPPGLSPAGPFASGSASLSLQPPAAPQSLPLQPASLPGSMDPPPSKAPAAAARAARAKKRKDAPAPEVRPAGGLSAAEAARQAKVVAERAAAELEQLPADLDEKEARAIKRAVRGWAGVRLRWASCCAASCGLHGRR